MVYFHTGYCHKHGYQDHLSGKCKQCSIEEQQTEEQRWQSLSTEEKLDELKRRMDNLTSRSDVL